MTTNGEEERRDRLPNSVLSIAIAAAFFNLIEKSLGACSSLHYLSLVSFLSSHFFEPGEKSSLVRPVIVKMLLSLGTQLTSD